MTTETPISETPSFTITTKIEKSAKRLNTAKVVAEQLNKATLYFEVSKRFNVPTIFIKFDGAKDSIWVASLRGTQDWCPSQYVEYIADSGREWYKAWAKNPFRNGYEFYLFEHLTDSANELVMSFIDQCIEAFDKEISDDSQKLQVSVSFSPVS